jgi:methanol--5-hydroxybenzimidazolylcobamide Co-methyltransferase
MPSRFRSLAYPEPDSLVFGQARFPLACGFNLNIGAGTVHPEVNFTLPIMEVAEHTWPQVLGHYDEMARHILERMTSLKVPGVVLEFELLPAMTTHPEWGAEITALLLDHLATAHQKCGLNAALRVTPTDIRDQGKRPALRSGSAWDCLMQSFEACRDAGAHILSIESIGGKEVHDQALVTGDIRGIVFALGILAPRDMAWLWDHIVALCHPGGPACPGADTACGFANTAMQLAHQKMLPEVLAAVVRAMSAVRSLIAFEQGALGPSKDCAYEGPIVKAVTGRPISMEGKSATCAHFSPLGNIASAICDLWSNESVQNVRLLSGNAPEAFAESLAYDCRLMNVASAHGQARILRDWLTESDQWHSPQAAVLSPEAACRIGQAIVAADDPYHRAIAAGRAAVAILEDALRSERLSLAPREKPWLNRIKQALENLPDTETELIAEMHEPYGALYDPASYGF